MSAGDWAHLRRSFGPGYVILLAVTVGLATLAALPIVAALAIAVVGATGASALRGKLPRRWRSLGLLPALASLAILVTDCPVGVVPDVVAGAAGLALLLWCSEAPDRAPGALGRGVGALAVPALGLGVALLSDDLLPTGLGTVGVAVGLLLVGLAAVLLLLASPGVFGRDPSASS